MWQFNKIKAYFEARKTRPVKMHKLFVKTEITLLHNDGGKSIILLEKMRALTTAQPSAAQRG